ncbi:MAG: TlpA family protein disulfide reductase [Saprospiraceae bacterium]|nr:TlpA family protein disulfide reductase [Saprospiraceae bacterium]
MRGLPLLSGGTGEIRRLLGPKLTLLDFWASWCAPCRKENRNTLVPLWSEYHERGFQIIGYALESDRKLWEKAIQRDSVHLWPHASHLQGDEAPFLKTLRLTTIPANLLLDAQGKILAKNLHGEELRRFVEAYLK